MKAHCFVGVLAVAGLLAWPAAAAFTPEEPWDSSMPMNEYNLYEMYNALYGTAFTSNSDLDSLQVSEAGLLALSSIAGAQSVTAEVVAYNAWLTHNVVWYEADGSNQEVLFGGIQWPDDTGIITDGRYTETFVPTGLFGFYDYTHIPGDNTVGYGWYSQAAYNLNAEDHFLLYSTPIENTFLVAWEDMPWVNPWPGEDDDPYELDSDRDYNDLVLAVRFNVIPEPASMVLLGIGIAALAVRKARKSMA